MRANLQGVNRRADGGPLSSPPNQWTSAPIGAVTPRRFTRRNACSALESSALDVFAAARDEVGGLGFKGRGQKDRPVVALQDLQPGAESVACRTVGAKPGCGVCPASVGHQVSRMLWNTARSIGLNR